MFLINHDSGGTVTPDDGHNVASIIVFDPSAAAVLLIRHRLSGCWQFPGGHPNAGEHLGDTAVREAREETGCEVVLVLQDRIQLPGFASLPRPYLVSTHRAPADPVRYPAHWHHDHLYVGVADSTAGTAPQLNEVRHAKWWPVDEVAGIPGVRQDVPVAVADAWQQVQAEQLVSSR